VNLSFSAEQLAFRDSLRGLLAAQATPAMLRQLWDTSTGRSAPLWKQLSEVGVPAVLVPEAFGGVGGDELDMMLVLEELGGAAVPDAILESCLLAPYLIGTCTSAGLRERWLPALAAGSVRITVARRGSQVAPDLHVSDAVLLERDGGLMLAETADVDATPLRSIDPSRRLFRVSLRGGAGEPLPGAGLAGASARALAGSAALLSGVAARLVALAADYAKVRFQFGRPIGSFQAVKHQLAQALSLDELARQATVAATYQVARGGAEAMDAAAMAHLCAVEAEAESNRVALQVHGGVGFTWEHDVQIWLKYGKTLELGYGTRGDAAALAGQAGLGRSGASGARESNR
jgi:alkylation response protein AidB-like acyl-CoA dehydrogenase